MEFEIVLLSMTSAPAALLILIACWLPRGNPNRAVLLGAAGFSAAYAAIKWHAIEIYPSDFGGFKGLLYLGIPSMSGILAGYTAILGCCLNGLLARRRPDERISATWVLSAVGMFVCIAVGTAFAPGFAAWPGF